MLTVLVFTDGSDARRKRRGTRLVRRLNKEGFAAQFIDRLSSNYDELVLVAKHGVVEPEVVLALDEDEVKARLLRLSPEDVVVACLRLVR